jgi:hypothetical protein
MVLFYIPAVGVNLGYTPLTVTYFEKDSSEMVKVQKD